MRRGRQRLLFAPLKALVRGFAAAGETRRGDKALETYRAVAALVVGSDEVVEFERDVAKHAAN